MLYLFVIIILIVLAFSKDFKSIPIYSNRYYILMYFIFALIAGLRLDVGTDTNVYVSLYQRIPTIDSLTSSFFSTTRYRPGIIVLYSLCKSIIPNFTFVLLVESFFVNYCIFKFIKRFSSRPFITLLFYFIINYLEFNMDIQREAISIALGLLCWMAYVDKKYIKALILLVFALEFHVSASMIVLYPLLDRIKPSMTSIQITIASVVVLSTVYFMIPNIEYVVSYLLNTEESFNVDLYAKHDMNNSVNFNAYLIHIIHFAFLSFCVLYSRNKSYNGYAGFVLALSSLFFLSTLISYGFYRFANYLAPFYWIALGEFIANFCIQYRNRFPTAFAAIFLLLYITYYHEGKLLYKDQLSLNHTYAYENYFPYKSVLFDGNYK